MNKVNSKAELINWLDDNSGFKDGFISELIKLDENTVQIRLGYHSDGLDIAGCPVILKEYVIIGTGLININENFLINPNHLIKGITLIETSNGIGIEIDTTNMIHIFCEEWNIGDPICTTTISRPLISDYGVIVTVFGLKLPKPKFWIEQLEKMGYSVGWKNGESDISLPEQVPYPDYSGWFLQDNKTNDTRLGIEVVSNLSEDNRFLIQFNRIKAESDIWEALTRIIANFPGVEMGIGNCLFSGKQWIHYLDTGEIRTIVTHGKE
jgi:hypothetical protein